MSQIFKCSVAFLLSEEISDITITEEEYKLLLKTRDMINNLEAAKEKANININNNNGTVNIKNNNFKGE